MEALRGLDGLSGVGATTGQAVEHIDEFGGKALAEFSHRQFQQLSHPGHAHVGQPLEFLLGEIHRRKRGGAYSRHRLAGAVAQAGPGENKRRHRGWCRR